MIPPYLSFGVDLNVRVDQSPKYTVLKQTRSFSRDVTAEELDLGPICVTVVLLAPITSDTECTLLTSDDESPIPQRVEGGLQNGATYQLLGHKIVRYRRCSRYRPIAK